MRKIIGGVSSFILTSSMVFGVMSCAPKTNFAVLLEVQTDNQGSAIVKAYRHVVDRYNADRPHNSRPVKIIVTPKTSIKDKIATGLALPNLYLAYADSMSTYDVLLQLRDGYRSSVNMAEVINWDEGSQSEWWNTSEDNWLAPYINNGSQINSHGLTGTKTLDEITGEEGKSYRPFVNSFLREGLIAGEAENSIFMYSAPIVKSNFIGVVNLRLLNELVVSVLGDNAKLEVIKNGSDQPLAIRPPHFIKQPQFGLKDLKINSLDNAYRLSKRNHYREDLELTFGEFFQQRYQGLRTEFELQKSLGDLSNVEVLLSAYWNLVGNKTTNTTDAWIKTFGYATDDVSATTGIMQGKITGNFQQITRWDPTQPYNLFVNTKDKQLHRGSEDFIDFIRWANDYKGLQADSANAADHGNGGVGVKANSTSKDYYSNQWIRQGMLLYYGSSSGVKYMTGTKENQVHNEEVILAPIPVYEDTSKQENWNLLFRQQGAGIGMFQDPDVEKNKIAIDFLNYFLSPQVNVDFAIQAGYIPTNYNAYYLNQLGTKRVPDSQAPYYKELLKGGASEIKGANIIQDLVDQTALETIKLWITEPSPFADAINFQVLQPWFQKYYKTFFDQGPKASTLTWEQYEKEFHKEARRVINSMFPGISHLVWNGEVE